MALDIYKNLLQGVQQGQIVPYLGPGILSGAVNQETQEPMPGDSDSLIYAMNNGQAMAPRLMYEFARAAMHVELKKGRNAVNKFLTNLYQENQWTRAPFHDWLAQLKPAYVIDINRDTQLQDSYQDIEHNLIKGVARIAGTQYRFKIYHYDGSNYQEIGQQDADASLPLLFKPMGSPVPQADYIASDADYVDYITELMGGFAIPDFLKTYRKGKQYLYLGMRFTRDTERMVMSDITYAADTPRGWAFIKEPNKKEQRYCARQNIEIIEADYSSLIEISDAMPVTTDDSLQMVGC